MHLKVALESSEEALANIREAVELYLEPMEEDFARSTNGEILEIAV